MEFLPSGLVMAGSIAGNGPPAVGAGAGRIPAPLAITPARWYIPPNFNHRSATEDSVMNTTKPAEFIAPPPPP
ncbi:MAG: hypothetical protein OXE47_10595, partial [Gammaproteobacteria bacterium]|nr:hypothetical protein [Gammaproteobacteria bacterium]